MSKTTNRFALEARDRPVWTVFDHGSSIAFGDGWTMRRDGMISIPKAGSMEHVEENRAAADLVLTEADLVALDAAFPRPRGSVPLEML